MSCSEDSFKCDNDKCINITRVCDKNNDCSDWSDEQACGKYLSYSPYELSRVMTKTDFYLCENKGPNQLCSNCTADQRLCFRFWDSTIPLLPLKLHRPVNARLGLQSRRMFFSCLIR